MGLISQKSPLVDRIIGIARKYAQEEQWRLGCLDDEGRLLPESEWPERVGEEKEAVVQTQPKTRQERMIDIAKSYAKSEHNRQDNLDDDGHVIPKSELVKRQRASVSKSGGRE